MNDRYRTPLKTALGLGSARHGVHHFVVQRMTAVALIVLGAWFVWVVLTVLHADYATARALVAALCVRWRVVPRVLGRGCRCVHRLCGSR